MHFTIRNRQMLYAVGDHNEFALADLDFPIAQAHPQPPLYHQKQLVLDIVVVPDELAFEFYELNLKVVNLRGDFGAPVVLNQAELFG